MIVLLRHAEKAGQQDDSPLTQAGVERAQKVAEILKNARINHIFSTRYKRNTQTASIIAEKLRLKVKIIHDESIENLKMVLTNLFQSDRVLFVGHSDINIQLAEKLSGHLIGGKAEYDDLHIMTREEGRFHHFHMNFQPFSSQSNDQ